VLNASTLTIGAEHPFLINTLFIKLPSAPSVNRAAVLRMQHENLKFEWENAQLELLDRAMRISLP
jgi:hypothetical protein